MKQLIAVLLVAGSFSCGSSEPEAPAQIKKVVCGDSVEQEMFDQDGKSFMVKVPGKCDTVLVEAEK